jgi:hypothetical protein
MYLKVAFFRIFTLSANLNGSIQDMGGWVNDVRTWRFERRSFFVWAESLIVELMNLIKRLTSTTTLIFGFARPMREVCVWLTSSIIFYTTNYPLLLFETRRCFCCWVNLAPFKVIVFAWQMIRNHLSNRVNRFRRPVRGGCTVVSLV